MVSLRATSEYSVLLRAGSASPPGCVEAATRSPLHAVESGACKFTSPTMVTSLSAAKSGEAYPSRPTRPNQSDPSMHLGATGAEPQVARAARAAPEVTVQTNPSRNTFRKLRLHVFVSKRTRPKPSSGLRTFRRRRGCGTWRAPGGLDRRCREPHSRRTCSNPPCDRRPCGRGY